MTSFRELFRVDSVFRPLVMEGDGQEIEPLVFRWSELDLTVRVVRGRKMRTRSGLFDEFAAALQFPLYFGENADAFAECIADLQWLPPGRGYVIVITEPSQVLADREYEELGWLIDSLASAARELGEPVELGEWWDRPGVPFHIVLAGELDLIEGASRRWVGSPPFV